MRHNRFFFILCALFLVLTISFVSAARLPTVGGDDDAWGTVLNEYLTQLAGPNATTLNITGNAEITGDLHMGGAITHDSPVLVKDGLAFINSEGAELFHLERAGDNSHSDSNLPSALDGALIIETYGENNQYAMEIVFWNVGVNRSELILNLGGSQRASTFDRSLQIGKSFGNASIDGNYTKCQGFNLIDCDTSLTGADLGVEDDIEAKGSIYTNENFQAIGNLTLGEKIVFAFGEVIDNIVDGWITITGGLNVTENLNVVGNATIEGNLNVTGTSYLEAVTVSNITGENADIGIHSNLNMTGNNITGISSLVAEGSSATAIYSNALGYQTVANGTYASAFGFQSIAEGSNSFAVGSQATASGVSAAAFGYQTIANNTGSVAMGDNTVASGLQSIALGYFTTASGMRSVAMGKQTTASGAYSVAMGESVTAGTASNTFAFGSSFINNIASSFAVGFGDITLEVTDNYVNITGDLNVSGNIGATGNVTADWFNGNLNWSDVQNAPTSDWLSTYNATYDVLVTDNSSWNQSFADTLYAPNTTAGIQALINSTGVYSTYNETYHGLINNASYLSTYNTTYDQWAYNQTIPSISYTDTQISAVNTTANIAELINNTVGWILNFSKIFSDDWSNITITENQISNLVHTINGTNINVLDINASSATIHGDLNVIGTSYLGDVTLTSDNITVNNILSKDGNISFYNSSGSETVRITQDGNVGIGVTAPLSELTITRGNPTKTPGNVQDIMSIVGRETSNSVDFRAARFIAERAATSNGGSSTYGLNAFVFDYGSVDLEDTKQALTGQRAKVGKMVSGGTIYSARAFSGEIDFKSSDTVTGTIIDARIFAAEPIDASQKGTILNAYSFYSEAHDNGTGGTIVNATGMWLEKQTDGSTTNYGIVLDGDGAGADIVFGAEQDANIFWDGSALVLNGSNVSVPGNLNVTGSTTISGNFSVDSSDLFVDVNSGRVGIGTTSPTQKLDVNGNMNVTGNVTADWFKGNLNWSDIQNAPTSDWLSTYNATYDQWAYNQTTPAISYTNTQISAVNTTENIARLINNTAGWVLNFSNIYSDDWTNVTITENQISNLVHTINGTNINVLDVNASSATIHGDLNVTGTSYLGDVILTSDNITVNNIIPKTGGDVDVIGNIDVTNNVTASDYLIGSKSIVESESPAPYGIDSTDLVGYWSGNGNAKDYSGYGYDGTLKGNATYSDGVFGTGFEFDGEGDYVDMGDIEALDSLDTITVSAWINGNDFDGSGNEYLVSKRNSGDNSWSLVYIAGEDNLRFDISTDSAAFAVFNNPSINVWYHVVGTYNGSDISLYIDGSLVHNVSKTGTMSNVAYSVLIGAEPKVPVADFFNGSIDEVMIFNRSLSATEISALYNAGNKFKTSGNSTYYEGNVGIGTTNPQAPLHVYSSGNVTVLTLQDTDGTCEHNPEAGSETVSCSSDKKLKKDIKNASSALEEFEDIKIKDYVVKASGKEITGVIAQEIRETNPEMVHETNGELFVEQPNPWKLLKAIQELKERIDALVGGNYSVESKTIFNEDSVGTAKVLVNETFVRVEFSEEYEVAPIVTLTVVGLPNFFYGVDEITTKGFKILISDAQEKEVVFNWHAFGQSSERVVNSSNEILSNESLITGDVISEINETEKVEEEINETEVIEEPVEPELEPEENITETPEENNITIPENVTEEIETNETIEGNMTEEVPEEEISNETIEETIEEPIEEEGNKTPIRIIQLILELITGK